MAALNSVGGTLPAQITPTSATPRRWTSEQIGVLVFAEAAKTGADPLLLLAIIDVETGGTFNNNIVGDGGTSFGLFQHHIGGAGGATKASAMRYRDPAVSVPERARALASARTGADAAAVQRPANRADYARKVDARLTAMRRALQSAPQGGAAAAAGGDVVAIAQSMVGKPYVWGGESPSIGFDCSGLLYWAFKQTGKVIPRTSQLQLRACDTIPAASAQRGDLVFFNNASHVGFYLGNGQMLNAPNRNSRVRVEAVWPNPTYGRLKSSSMQTVSLSGAASSAVLAIPGFGSALGAALSAGRTGKAAAVAGAASDVGAAIKDAVENLLKGGFRYALIIALLVVASVLALAGIMRTFGAVKETA